MAETTYCASCGTQTPVEQSLQGEYLLSSCAYCGLGLGVTRASQAIKQRFAGAQGPSAAARPSHGAPPAIPSAPAAPTGAMPVIQAPVRQMGRVYVVEDSQLLRTLTRDLLNERRLSREVVEAADGQAFLESYTRDLIAGLRPDLIVLDVKMPGLDGREVAFAMRAIEAAMGMKATPILFFSSLLCDEPFKLVLKQLSNARYIRKGDDSDAAALGARVVSVLERLVGAGQS